MHYDDSVYVALKRMLRKDFEERADLVDKQIRGFKVKQGKNEKLIRAFTQKFATVTDKRLEEDLMVEYDRLKEEQELLSDDIKALEDTKGIDTDMAIDSMKLCCNLREHYGNLEADKQRALLALCFNEIIVSKGTYRINGGKGKRVKVEQIQARYNEPFATLRALKIDELLKANLTLAESQALTSSLTKRNDSKDNLFP